jgi:hypothetical protein
MLKMITELKKRTGPCKGCKSHWKKKKEGELCSETQYFYCKTWTWIDISRVYKLIVHLRASLSVKLQPPRDLHTAREACQWQKVTQAYLSEVTAVFFSGRAGEGENISQGEDV